MEILHALRGLSVSGSAVGAKEDRTEAGVSGKKAEEDDRECRKSKLRSLPPKSPKKGSSRTVRSDSKKQTTGNAAPPTGSRSQSLGGYYHKSDPGSTGELSRKSSLSSLSSLISMSPRLFPRFGAKSANGSVKSSGRKRPTPLSPHRENACTNDFYPAAGSCSRTSSRCGSPAPSECRSLPPARCRSPDLMSSCDAFHLTGNEYRPEMYLDPNQGMIRAIYQGIKGAKDVKYHEENSINLSSCLN
jgi:hypothetical protein